MKKTDSKKINRKIKHATKYRTPDDLLNKINEYFEVVEENEITITGLCLYLGIHKDTFYEYAKRDEFKDIINMARLIVENSYEMELRKEGRTGTIFALKNFGWKDKIEYEGETKTNGIISDLVEALNNAKKNK